MLNCDKCGQPILPGQARYTVADNLEAGTGRHYDCQPKLGDFRESLDKLREAGLKLRKL